MCPLIQKLFFIRTGSIPVLFHPFNEGPKVRINDKMVKWSAKRNNRGRFSATRGAENLRRHGS